VFALCLEYQMLCLPGRRGRHLVQMVEYEKEGSGMAFKPTASAAQEPIREALLLLTGAKRGAKRQAQFRAI
jgi:hypothetical protein